MQSGGVGAVVFAVVFKVKAAFVFEALLNLPNRDAVFVAQLCQHAGRHNQVFHDWIVYTEPGLNQVLPLIWIWPCGLTGANSKSNELVSVVLYAIVLVAFYAGIYWAVALFDAEMAGCFNC